MENLIIHLRTLLLFFGGIIGFIIGGFDVALSVLLFLVIMDYITGIIAAFYEGNIDSMVAFKCIPKKVLIFLLVAMAFQADRLLETNSTIRMAVVFFYVGMEGISIIENCGRAGMMIPKPLIDAFKQLKEQRK